MNTTLLKKDFPYKHWEYFNHQTGNRLRIVPERGGLITEWLCNGHDVLYFDLERFQQESKSVRGGIPILFPICGNLPRNCFCIDQSEFIINQHGFARDNSWNIDFLDDQQGFALSLFENKDTLEIFPYSFSIVIEVRCMIKTLYFDIKITNLSKRKMPFSFGLHPYFNVKDLKNISIDGLNHDCQDQKIDSSTVQTKKQLENLHQGVDFLVRESQRVILHDPVAGKRLELKHQQPMDLTVIWTDPPRNMICIEPWTSPRESLLTGDRKIILEEQEFKKLQFEVSLI